MTLEELAGGVRRGTVSAAELVTMSLERIERLDPSLNAVILVCGDEALARAREVDAGIAGREDLGPLAGLPLLVKDMEDVVGLPSTYGLRCSPTRRRHGDALVPRRFREWWRDRRGKTNQAGVRVAGIRRTPSMARR
jgi:Asp-tRNA(Asn)/Glu-tRNA(Gln) amidotransferase A subunit family amidase